MKEEYVANLYTINYTSISIGPPGKVGGASEANDFMASKMERYPANQIKIVSG